MAAVAAPDVSVVIVGYNDAKNLPVAVASVQCQTLHNLEILIVDDCSTDDTVSVARALAEQDPRIRVLSTPTNSGGPGAPRNIGLREATGRYVTLLDSDDELERHACINLLREAERTGVDLVMAQTHRLDVAKDKRFGWHRRLFLEPRTLDSIEDDVELAVDTIAVAKLYRREFLTQHQLSFPEGLHYEDLVFSARMFQAAKGISVLREVVYIWKLYPSEVRQSITHQRDSIRNLEQRLKAIDIALESIDQEQFPGLFARLQLKIIRHDARIYLFDVADGKDVDLAAATLNILGPVLAAIPEQILLDTPMAERFMSAGTILGNVEMVREAVQMHRGTSDFLGPVEIGEPESTWHPEEVASAQQPIVDRLARFETSELTGLTWFGYRIPHDLVKLQRAQGKLRVRGRSYDPFAHFDRDDLVWSLRLNEREGQRRYTRFPLSITRREGGVIEWEGVISLPGAVDLTTLSRLTIRLEISGASVSSVAPVLTRRKVSGAKLRLSAHSRLDRLFGVRYQPYTTVERTLALKPSPVQAKRAQLRRALKPLVAVEMKRRQDQLLTAQETGEKAFMARYAKERRRPLDPTLVLVESHMGTSEHDSPRDIIDELRKQRPDLRIVWSAARGSMWSSGRGDVVRRHTHEYLRALATATWIVDNQTLPPYYEKRSGQQYVQTWHGIPLKRMGLDQAKMQHGAAEAREELVRRSGMWDFLTIPSEFFRSVFVPAFNTTARELPLGSPRNDRLVRQEPGNSAAKAVLGLDPRRPTVLYAPTFRDGARGAVALELDLERWVEAMGDRVQLLVRPHYLNAIRVPAGLRRDVVDVSKVKDTALVMQAADLLITDYSSVMFDYLALDRPQVLYTYDLDDYMFAARGTYFDLRQDAPGPLVSDQEQLMDAVLGRLDADPDAVQRAAFRDRYAGTEPGNAAAATVESVWGAKK